MSSVRRGSQAADGAGLESRWSKRSSGVQISPSALISVFAALRGRFENPEHLKAIVERCSLPQQARFARLRAVSPSALISVFAALRGRFENPEHLKAIVEWCSLPQQARFARSPAVSPSALTNCYSDETVLSMNGNCLSDPQNQSMPLAWSCHSSARPGLFFRRQKSLNIANTIGRTGVVCIHRKGVAGIYRIILGTFPISDFRRRRKQKPGNVASPGLLRAVRLSEPASEVVRIADDSPASLKNHRKMPVPGRNPPRPKLLGHEGHPAGLSNGKPPAAPVPAKKNRRP